MNNKHTLRTIITLIITIPVLFTACTGAGGETTYPVEESAEEPMEEPAEEPVEEVAEEPMETPEYTLIERYPHCYFDIDYSENSVYCYIEGSSDEGGAHVYFERDDTPEPFWVAIDLSMTEDLSSLYSSDDDFIPTRIIANLEVIDPWKDELVSDFNPPIRLTAEYFQEDVENAIKIAQEAGFETIAIEEMTIDDVIEYLVFGFWDENLSKWVSFSNSKIWYANGDGTGGYITVEIYEWGDRYIGFGGGGGDR